MSGTVRASNIYPISEMFPKANYKTTGKPMVLHYLIAYERPEKTIREWIDQNPQHINTSHPNRQLTPLAVSVIMQNEPVTALLLEKKADPTMGDINGWTPFHHAAVIGNDQILLLLTQKAEETVANKLLNLQLGSYQDLRDLVSTKMASPEEMVCFYRKGHEVTECTAGDFTTLTRASYCKSVFIPPSALVEKWRTFTKKSATTKVDEFLREEYLRYLNKPPKLSFGIDAEAPPHGFDVFVEEDLKTLQGITIYGGCFEVTPSEREYLLVHVNGKKIRNLGPMICDGFPNCVVAPFCFRGFDYSLFLAARDLKAGEKLFFHYGMTHRVKLIMPHFELNRRELDHYVGIDSLFNRFINLYHSCSQEKLEGQNKLLHFIEIQKLAYVLETPSLWLYFLSNRLNTVEEIFRIFSTSPSSYFEAVGLSTDYFELRKEFAKNCTKLKRLLEQVIIAKQMDLIRTIQATCFRWSENLSTITLLGLFDYASTYFDHTNAESFNDKWNRFIENTKTIKNFLVSVSDFCITTQEIPDREFLQKAVNEFEQIAENMMEIALRHLKNYCFLMRDARKKIVLEKLWTKLSQKE